MTLLFLCILSILSINSLSKLLGENEYSRQLYTTPSGAKIDFGAFFNRINQSLDDKIVDMTADEMSKAYYGGNLCPIHRKVISKMMRNENIKVLIIGGSVTYGADLKNRLKQRWSNSFTEILNSGWYSGKFEVSNIGVGACNIDVWINRVREFTSTDLLIVDLSVNDQGFELQALPLLYDTFIQLVDNLPNKPAIFFHYAFRGAKFDINDINDHCPNEYIKCCHGEMFCKRWWDMQDFVAQTLHKYHIPFVSYRDLVWPDYAHPSHELIHFWNGLSHPDGHAHALIAKLIAFGLFNQMVEGARAANCSLETKAQYTKLTTTNESIVPLCLHPLTKMTATDTKDSHRTFQLALPDTEKAKTAEVWDYHHWIFQADSRNKYGWIVKATNQDMKQLCSITTTTTEKSSSCSAFQQAYDLPLQIMVSHQEAIVQVSYLKSYHDNMGSVKIWLDEDDTHAIVLNGKWDLPYSVTRLITISREPLNHVSTFIKGDAYTLPGLTEGKHILHIAMHGCEQETCKWKLLSVVTC